MPESTHEFTCEQCGGTFIKKWSDEERQAEYETNFSEEVRGNEETVTVCDDCYKFLMARYRRMEGKIR